MAQGKVPNISELLQPTLTALHELGGIAGTFMVDDAVIQNLGLPKAIAERPHLLDDSRSELRYRIAWARTYLKNCGLVENPQRGLWQLTPLGRRTQSVDPAEVDTRSRRRKK